MVKRIKDLSIYRFNKANENIEVAEILYKSKHYNQSLNRSYYACFDTMRSVNALDGFDSSKHSGVISYFNQNYIKTKKIELTNKEVIKKASKMREKSDYEDYFEATNEDAKEILMLVKIFINDVKKYLISNEVLNEKVKKQKNSKISSKRR